MELVEPIIAITADNDKVRIQSHGIYRCNNGFALSTIEEVVSKNPCRAVKGACGVGILMRSTAMVKFKRGLNLEDVCGG